MPIILPALLDPSSDLTLQGELMRSELVSIDATYVIAGEQNFSPTQVDFAYSSFVLSYSNLPRVNSGISNQDGTFLPHHRSGLLINQFIQSSSRWKLDFQVVDSSDVAVPGARVIVMETGRLAAASSPVIAETISDGSGNVSIEVPQNTTYFLIAYKPDRGGVSMQNSLPVQT